MPRRRPKHVLLGLRLSGAEVSSFDVRLWRSLVAPTCAAPTSRRAKQADDRQESSRGTAPRSPPVGVRVVLRNATASLSVSKVLLKHEILPLLVDHGLLLLSPIDLAAKNLGQAWVAHDAVFKAEEVELRFIAVPWAPHNPDSTDLERLRVNAARWDGRPVVRLTGSLISSRSCQHTSGQNGSDLSVFGVHRGGFPFSDSTSLPAVGQTPQGAASMGTTNSRDSSDEGLINLSIASLRVLLRSEDRDAGFSLTKTYLRKILSVVSHLSEPPWQLLGQVSSLMIKQQASKNSRAAGRGMAAGRQSLQRARSTA